MNIRSETNSMVNLTSDKSEPAPRSTLPSLLFHTSRTLCNAITRVALINPDDYEYKYPEDEIGHEADESARVWRVYLDVANKSYAKDIDNWREDVHVVFILAGLCSAVIAPFVIESLKGLDDDYTALNAFYLREIALLQRVAATGGDLNDVPLLPFGSMIPEFDPWNTYPWMGSLICFIAVALIASVVKRWMQSPLPFVNGTPLKRVRRWHSWYGRRRQQLILSLSSIYTIMNSAALLFFWGLAASLFPVGSGAFAFTICATFILILALSPICTQDMGRLLKKALELAGKMRFSSARMPQTFPPYVAEMRSSYFAERRLSVSMAPPSVSKSPRSVRVGPLQHLDADFDALAWMAMSSDESVQFIAAQAVGGLVGITAKMRPDHHRLEDVLICMSLEQDIASSVRRLDRVFRGFLHFFKWRIQLLSSSQNASELSHQERESCLQLTRNLVDHIMDMIQAESEAILTVQERRNLAAGLVGQDTNALEITEADDRVLAFQQEWELRKKFFNQHLIILGLSQFWHDTRLYNSASPDNAPFSFLRLFFDNIKRSSQPYEEFIDSLRTGPMERRGQLSAFAVALASEGKDVALANALLAASSPATAGTSNKLSHPNRISTNVTRTLGN